MPVRGTWVPVDPRLVVPSMLGAFAVLVATGGLKGFLEDVFNFYKAESM